MDQLCSSLQPDQGIISTFQPDLLLEAPLVLAVGTVPAENSHFHNLQDVFTEVTSDAAFVL